MKRSQSLSTGSASAGSGSGRFMSRSEGLRSSGGGSGGFSTRASKMKGKGSGRSLADLASRFTSGSTPSSSGRSHSHRGSLGAGSGGLTRDGLGSSGGLSSGGGSGGGMGLGGENSSSLAELMELEKNIVRYTRERLLSMRPRPSDGEEALENLPSSLLDLEGTSLFSKEPLDPGTFISYICHED